MPSSSRRRWSAPPWCSIEAAMRAYSRANTGWCTAFSPMTADPGPPPPARTSPVSVMVDPHRVREGGRVGRRLRMREDDEGFSAFVLTAEGPLLRTAYLLTGDRGHAEDLVQTALTNAYRHWDRVAAAESPLAYVRRVLVNAHLSWRRRAWSTEQVVEALPDRTGPDLQDAQAEEDAVRRALRGLSPRVRAVLVLRY